MLKNSILIADDDSFYRCALAGLLRDWGYDVAEACDGAQAWQLLQAEDAPKIAIIDWTMPVLDGVQVCRRVRTLSRAEPTYLIMLTAKEGKDSLVQALGDGADDFIQKPFDHDELRARLRVGERVVGLQACQTAVFAFARACEAKSPFTQGHADRVAHYALALATEVGVNPHELETLRRGAILHDIGKICTPDQILNKPDPLSKAEFDLIKEHPVRGAEIVKPFRILANALALIRSHHERCDGKGYPDGLRGDEIPFLVRILSVADVYDALRSERPYRRSLPHEHALQMVVEDAQQGGLDPDLARRFGQLPSAVFADIPVEADYSGYRLAADYLKLPNCA